MNGSSMMATTAGGAGNNNSSSNTSGSTAAATGVASGPGGANLSTMKTGPSGLTMSSLGAAAAGGRLPYAAASGSRTTNTTQQQQRQASQGLFTSQVLNGTFSKHLDQLSAIGSKQLDQLPWNKLQQQANAHQPNAMDSALKRVLESLREKCTSHPTGLRSWTDLSKICSKLQADKARIQSSSLYASQSSALSSLSGESEHKQSLQRALDTIQRNVEIISIQSMVERLEALTRSLPGLKFTHTGHDCFISSEMFYVEVTLEKNSGKVMDVKVAHHNDPVSCPELTRVLSEENFPEFCSHLEGLSAIYAISGEKKAKTKAYVALTALETDLAQLAQLQSSVSVNINNLIYKSPVGILERRRGGFPMTLTYFVSPYDLLDIAEQSSSSSKTTTSSQCSDKSQNQLLPLSIDLIKQRNIGQLVRVQIESSTIHKIQTCSLIQNVSKNSDGKSYPSFGQHSNLNSSPLAARFVLQLSHPMPMSLSLVRQIASVVKMSDFSVDKTQNIHPLAQLIAYQALNGTTLAQQNQHNAKSKKNTTNGTCNGTTTGNNTDRMSVTVLPNSLPAGPYFVPLPDQLHAYRIDPPLSTMEGVLVDRVPFTHPTHVPPILVLLRSQALFNFTLGTCMRKMGPMPRRPPLSSHNSRILPESRSSSVSSKTIITNGSTKNSQYQYSPRITPLRPFDLSATSISTIYVTFENPTNDSLACAEFDLRDITGLKCRITSNSNSSSTSSVMNSSTQVMCSDEQATKIFSKCWSIPITMRSIWKVCEEKAAIIARRQRAAAAEQNVRSLSHPGTGGGHGGGQSGSGGSQNSGLGGGHGGSGSGGSSGSGNDSTQITDILLHKLMEAQNSTTSALQSPTTTGHKGPGRPPGSLSRKGSVESLAAQTANNASKMLMSMLSDTPAANQSDGGPTQAKQRKSRKRTVSGANDDIEIIGQSSPVTQATKYKRKRAESQDSNKSGDFGWTDSVTSSQVLAGSSLLDPNQAGINAQQRPSTLPIKAPYSGNITSKATPGIAGPGQKKSLVSSSTGNKPGPKPGAKAAARAALQAAQGLSGPLTAASSIGNSAPGKVLKQKLAGQSLNKAVKQLVAQVSSSGTLNTGMPGASVTTTASSGTNKPTTTPSIGGAGVGAKKTSSLNAVLARLHAGGGLTAAPTSTSSATSGDNSSGDPSKANQSSLKNIEKLKYTVKSSGKSSSDLKITIKRPSSTTTSPAAGGATSSSSAATSSASTTTSSSAANLMSGISPELSHIFNKPQTTSKGFTIPKKKTVSPSLPSPSTSEGQQQAASNSASAALSAAAIAQQQAKMRQMLAKHLPGGVSSTTSFSNAANATILPGGQRVSSSGPGALSRQGPPSWTPGGPQNKGQVNTSPHFRQGMGQSNVSPGFSGRPPPVSGGGGGIDARTSPSSSFSVSPRAFSSTSPSAGIGSSAQSLMQARMSQKPRSNPNTPPMSRGGPDSMAPDSMANYFTARGAQQQQLQQQQQMQQQQNRMPPIHPPQRPPPVSPSLSSSSPSTSTSTPGVGYLPSHSAGGNKSSPLHSSPTSKKSQSPEIGASIPNIESPSESSDVSGSATPTLPKTIPGGVSSSSDGKAATSTPSSPAECGVMDAHINAPTIIIPTESIHEPDQDADGHEQDGIASSGADDDPDPDQLILDISEDAPDEGNAAVAGSIDSSSEPNTPVSASGSANAIAAVSTSSMGPSGSSPSVSTSSSTAFTAYPMPNATSSGGNLASSNANNDIESPKPSSRVMSRSNSGSNGMYGNESAVSQSGANHVSHGVESGPASPNPISNSTDDLPKISDSVSSSNSSASTPIFSTAKSQISEASSSNNGLISTASNGPTPESSSNNNNNVLVINNNNGNGNEVVEGSDDVALGGAGGVGMRPPFQPAESNEVDLDFQL